MRSKSVGARIAKLVEEAIVDCYTEDEQHGSFLVMLEEHLRCPVRALVVGEDVIVVAGALKFRSACAPSRGLDRGPSFAWSASPPPSLRIQSTAKTRRDRPDERARTPTGFERTEAAAEVEQRAKRCM